MKQQSSIFVLAVIAIVAIVAFTLMGQRPVQSAPAQDMPMMAGKGYMQPETGMMRQAPMMETRKMPMMLPEEQKESANFDSVGCSHGSRSITCAPSLDPSCRCMPDGTPTCTCK